MNGKDVLSVRPKLLETISFANSLLYAQAIAKGWHSPPILVESDLRGYETAPFNFGNMGDPIPANVYFDAKH
jgi:hypothetical protein